MSPQTLDLVLVRHGVTDWNEEGRLMGRLDVVLNARGRAQAAAVAEAVRALPLRAVLASPQRRAQETAEPIAAAHGLSVETEPDLAEVWIDRWQGKTFVELADDPDIVRYLDNVMHACDAIEPAADVQARMVQTSQRVAQRFPDGAVALVSHGDPLRLLLAHYLGLDLPGFRRLHVAPGSVSVVRLHPRHAQLLAINWRPGELVTALQG